jgi:hypothetical protein
MFKLLLITNIFASFFMCGLIWFVQIVQYPSFLKVPAKRFQQYHQAHIWRTGVVVIPPMVVELGSSIWLVILFNSLWIYNLLGLILVIAIWISTFILQAPLHQQLQQQHSTENITKLIASNRIRTALWTIKSLIGVYIVISLI